MKLTILAAAALAALPALSFAQSWQPKQAKLMTQWAKDVNPTHVLPEYPRPQMQRNQWLNLNGLWQYQPGTAGEQVPTGKLSQSILVPFPVESALSGVMEQHDRIWYRRTFTVPANWKGQRILLHFGAVDYESEVWVNGKSQGVHTGGYDPFTYDITSAIKGSGPQEITVRVYDPTDNGGFPRGKQTLHPQGIMYTSTTGIWQTVWLEPVPAVHIEDFRITPDIDRGVVKITVNADDKATVNVQVKDGATIVQSAKGAANTEIIVPVPNAKLWSPDAPFLYDLSISIAKGGKTTDKVNSYFGMRKISVGEEGGYKKLFLNNKFLFQIGPLDQGFWPDGIYTAPTDAAIKNDLQKIKDYGFNMIRKHIKVEPYRWYYWADKLGLLVWQDMPSPNSYTEHVPPVDTAAYASELTRLVKTHWNTPSIVTWVIFNESQGQHNTPGLVSMVRGLDSSRLINQASGGTHYGVGDFLDIHSYPPPAVPKSSTQVLACGEYGGIGYIVPGHTWATGPTYIMMDNTDAYTKLYNDYARDLVVFKTNNGLSAAVYTEITDVEVELNGLMTYDRIPKAPIEKFRASNEMIIHGERYLKTVLSTSEETAHKWQYTISEPAANWAQPVFNDSSWQSGLAGFGTDGTPGAHVRTNWSTHDIWMRQNFDLDMNASDLDNLILMLHHDDKCEVYINGVLAADAGGATGGYSIVDVNDAGKKALNLHGKNTIAIHCHQDGGGQYIDAGLSLILSSK
jgi:hypothetical protein